MSVKDHIQALTQRVEFLERVLAKFPDIKENGQYFYSPSVNYIAEHVDIIHNGSWPFAMPYILFEGTPIYSDRMMFGLTTDEGYEVEWRQQMKNDGINPSILLKTEAIIQEFGYDTHFDTQASSDSYEDAFYGARRF